MTTRYRTVDVDGVNVSFREAESADATALLLLHGFPTSSHMFSGLIPALADRHYAVAPDLPGLGFSDAPGRASFKYGFDHLAEVVDRFTEVHGLSRYAIYVFAATQSTSSITGHRLVSETPYVTRSGSPP
jgi:pimeloyl-ACP methyl ester carboxylesterase